MKQGDRIQDGHQYGFFMIPNEMIDNHIENMGALGFVVYSVLMRHSNASSQCFPSYNTLIKKSSLSRPTIAKCIDHLVRKGYIRKLEIGHSKGHATTYQLLDLSLVPTSEPNELVKEVNQLTSLTSKGGLPVTSKGGLPQLVNVVNSNNTHLTKPIKDRSDDFVFFENANPENSQVTIASQNPKLDDASKCDSKPSDESKDKTLPVKVINPIDGDSPRRALEDFILKSMSFAPRDRTAYFSKFGKADWEKWEAKFKPPSSQVFVSNIFVPEIVEIADPDSPKVKDAIAQIKAALGIKEKSKCS